MNYVHQVVDSDVFVGIFTLPDALKNRKVEVIILPVQDKQESIQRKSSFGCFQKYANASLISEEKGAWERAVRDKYANS